MNKDRKYGFHPAAYFFLATWLVMLISWISDIYGVYILQPDTGEMVSMQSLLSPEGMRWWLRSLVDNFIRFACPGQVVVVSFGLGVALHAFAGYRPHSLKKRRALITALLIAGIYLSLMLFLTFVSGGILRGINGEITLLSHIEDLLFLLSLGMGLTGITYGYVSNRYRKDHNILEGLTYLTPFLGIYFVVSFFASQLFACIEYTHMDKFLALWLGYPVIPWRLLYGLPLLLAYFQYRYQFFSNSAR
ncbi:AbgT putative transporter [gut metagenome]|uniref:AbgT putative transporter n=1 Tax=gut metagenome TaxID=749906 RepID=J9GKB7_9ZZZZ